MNISKQKESPVPKIARDTERADTRRERSAGFGGPRLKLSVPQTIPGMHLFFQNDEDNGAIEQLLYEGFSFVTKAEVGLARKSETVVADEDVTDRVSRFVGRKEDGTPLRAFLLKCPEELWAQREEWAVQEANDKEDSLRQSITNPDSQDGRYALRGSRPEFNRNYRKEYN